MPEREQEDVVAPKDRLRLFPNLATDIEKRWLFRVHFGLPHRGGKVFGTDRSVQHSLEGPWRRVVSFASSRGTLGCSFGYIGYERLGLDEGEVEDEFA